MTRLHLAAFVFAGFGACWIVLQMIVHRSIWVGGHSRQFHQTHHNPIPRIGGLGLAAALVLALLAVSRWAVPPSYDSLRSFTATMAGAFAMFALGFIDDLHPIRARWKFLVQILVAIGVVSMGQRVDMFRNPFTGEVFPLGWFGFVGSVFWFVAITNLINLVDGLDGLAGGISLMVLCLMVFVGIHGGGNHVTVVSLVMCGALSGFLYFNFPPARVYMGDGGAYLLGFLIASLAVSSSHKGTVFPALAAPALALALPIYDVSMAILRRGVRGLPIFRPDRKHIHHRLAQMGLSPTKAVLILYAISLLFLALGLSVFWTGGRMLPVAIACAFLLGLVGLRAVARLRNWMEVRHLLGTAGDIRRESRYALTLCRWLEQAAEREESPEEIWRDFTFAASKVGLVSVRIQSADVTREWRDPRYQEFTADLTDEVELTTGVPVQISYAGLTQVTPPKTFFLMTELLSEAWMKCAQAWQIRRGVSLRLPPAPATQRSSGHTTKL
jgi:UDP-GlcNAc:undecaprenyl-phosphate GlcNAc-1-phosphate transferase